MRWESYDSKGRLAGCQALVDQVSDFPLAGRLKGGEGLTTRPSYYPGETRHQTTVFQNSPAAPRTHTIP
jgi:hypothetical protein